MEVDEAPRDNHLFNDNILSKPIKIEPRLEIVTGTSNKELVALEGQCDPFPPIRPSTHSGGFSHFL